MHPTKEHTPFKASCTSATMAQPQQACVANSAGCTWLTPSYEVLYFSERIRVQV